MNKLRFYAVYLLLALTVVFLGFHRDVKIPAALPLEGIPYVLKDWVKIDEVYFSEAVLRQLRPTDYLYRVYKNEQNQQVAFYLGYHGGGPDSGPIHSPKHCLPGSGWRPLTQQIRKMRIGNEEIQCVEAVYQNGDSREMFLYWYQVKGETLTSEYMLKLSEIVNSILYRRRDSAFVRISTTYQSNQVMQLELVEQFVRDFYPAIQSVLPH
ncbi:MAG: EpsI family protein [Desulfuromonadaceae bacterium]|nr:EpsI family protein [Desulfuromonadaceae bacterium]